MKTMMTMFFVDVIWNVQITFEYFTQMITYQQVD